MNQPPGGNRPPGPPGAWPGHGAPPTQPQGPYGHPQPGPYGHPPQAQGPYGGPPPGAYPAPPHQGYPQQGYPQQQQYPQQAYPQPGYQQYPQQPGYPPGPGYPQMIVVQNQVNPYGGQLAPDMRKKDVALLLAVCGLLFGICGAQKFYLRQVGMGVLYFFTGGLCLIGQVIDIIQLATMSQQEFDMRYNVIR